MACQSAPEQGWQQEMPASLRAAEEHGLSLGRAAWGRGPAGRVDRLCQGVEA